MTSFAMIRCWQRSLASLRHGGPDARRWLGRVRSTGWNTGRRASMAYVLICALRRLGLAHTQFAQATCDTIRLRLLKIGALVRISIRRIKVAMASAFPHQHEFALARALLSNTGR